MFTTLASSLALSNSFFPFLYSSFGAEIFALCLLYHCIREAVTLFLFFYKVHNEVTKESFVFRPLSNAKQLNLGDPLRFN